MFFMHKSDTASSGSRSMRPRMRFHHFPRAKTSPSARCSPAPIAFAPRDRASLKISLDVATCLSFTLDCSAILARAQIEDYEVESGADGVIARDIKIWQPNPDGTGTPAQVFYDYTVARPLTACFRKRQQAKCFSMLDTVTPDR